MGVIYTVGHGARTAQELTKLLTGAGVTVLADVRRFPGSRRHPQFGQAALAQALDAVGIRYEWHGEALGGRRARSARSRHRALRVAAFAGYADHLETPAARAAVEALVARADADAVAVMCAEILWWRCHRMIIADALTLRGARVVHLVRPGERRTHRLHATARADADGWPVYDVSDTLPGVE